MRSRPTIKDVAALADVSRQTVSRVTNNRREVSPETRDRVLAAIEELGYRPSAAARSMVVGRTRMLGCISPSLTDFTFASVAESAQAEARREGYSLLAGSAPTVADIEPLLEELLQRQVDGLLVLNPCADDRDRYLAGLAEEGIPVVYFGSGPEDGGSPLVRCDDLEAAYEATRYLVELGHTAVATIAGPSNEKCTFDRLEGYQRALGEAGLEAEQALVVRGDWSATSGHQGAQQLLDTGRPFSAVFAHNDRMAVGAISALRQAGRRVPTDVSVIGFDDIPLASYFDPPLTTLRQPMEAFGQRAAQLLIETIQNPATSPQQVLLPARLIERASCAPPRP